MSGHNDPFQSHKGPPPASSRHLNTDHREGHSSIGPSHGAVPQPRPFPAEAAPGAGAQPFHVANDPFLTHTHALPPGQPQQLENMAGYPGYKAAPALSHQAQLGHKPKPNNDKGVQSLYTYVPWLCFIWMVLLWTVLRQFAPLITVIVTVLVIAGGIMLAVQFSQRTRGQVSLFYLGALIALFSIAGVHSGMQGWSLAMRQYWWIWTGARFEGQNTGETAAASRVDAAYINFFNEGNDKTWDNTVVDHLRSAGFREHGTMFCAAPILTPKMSTAGLPRVEYWAIGTDCCQTLGGFACDASRDWNGGVAVPMLQGGLPCAGCNKDMFAAAIHKAEKAFDIVSGDGALRVRWVSDVQVVRTDLLYSAGIKMFWHCFFAFVVALLTGMMLVRDGLAVIGLGHDKP